MRSITSSILFALAALSGCASLDIQRKVYDDRGHELATVSVRHPLATSEGAAQLLESARRLEETKQDGDAERRLADIASRSVDKEQPTTVATRGGNVSSGYTGYGYGQYGYDPYGYSGYGPTMYYPGSDPNMVRVERAWRLGMYQILPPLGEPIVPFSQVPGTAATQGGDPSLRQDIDHIRMDINALFQALRPERK